MIPLKANKLFLILIAGLALSAVPFTSTQAESLLSLENPEIAALKAEIESLKQRIAVLESQKDQLNLALPQEALARDKAVPDDWRELEFQGQKFYVVPLNYTLGK